MNKFIFTLSILLLFGSLLFGQNLRNVSPFTDLKSGYYYTIIFGDGSERKHCKYKGFKRLANNFYRTENYMLVFDYPSNKELYVMLPSTVIILEE